MRGIIDAMFHVPRGSIRWWMLPDCLPPRQTVHGWFLGCHEGGGWDSVDHHLVMLDRERAGRKAIPSAAAVDSQSVRTTEAGGPRGFDAGKRIKGRKRHLMGDTEGRPLVLQTHPVDARDHDGAVPMLQVSRCSFPLVERAFADTAHAAKRVAPSIRAAGPSSAASHGATAIVGWPKIAKPVSRRQPSPATPFPSCYSCGDWLVPYECKARFWIAKSGGPERSNP